MVTQDDIMRVLETINDPEMPISIVDLGMVHTARVETDRVHIELLPTFVGCPALPVLEQEIKQRVGALAGVTAVDIHFRFDPPWNVDRISERGRESLRQIGVTVPGLAASAAPHCPFCGSDNVQLESSFGPTRCRMIYYCAACRNPFEHMKRVGIPTANG